MNNKEFKNKTLVLKKEAWIALRNYDRLKQGFGQMPAEFYDRIFKRCSMRNLGANPATHPIADDEIRIIPSDYDMPYDEVVFYLDYVSRSYAKGEQLYRDDGFVQEGINI